jgi:hypothetical protein
MKFTRSISCLIGEYKKIKIDQPIPTVHVSSIYKYLPDIDILDIDIWDANDAVKINVFK